MISIPMKSIGNATREKRPPKPVFETGMYAVKLEEVKEIVGGENSKNPGKKWAIYVLDIVMGPGSEEGNTGKKIEFFLPGDEDFGRHKDIAVAAYGDDEDAFNKAIEEAGEYNTDMIKGCNMILSVRKSDDGKRNFFNGFYAASKENWEELNKGGTVGDNGAGGPPPAKEAPADDTPFEAPKGGKKGDSGDNPFA